MFKLQILFLIFFSIFLSSCSYLGDSSKVSVPANRGNIAALRTPPGKDISFNTLYPIPHSAYPPVNQVNITPPGLYPSKNSGKTVS